MTSYLHRIISSALAISAATGCSEQLPAPPIVWEGEHLRFGTDADEQTLCAGTLPYLDDAAGYLGNVFGAPVDPLDYYWLPDGLDPYCPDGAEGCSTDLGVFSVYGVHLHELVHGIRRPRLMALPLEEGLAEAFGDDWDPSYGLQGDISSVLREPELYFPGTGYGRAGHFFSYLLATHGLDAVLSLEGATEYTGSTPALEQAFEQAMGESLDEAIADYEANYPRCDMRTYRDKALDCSRNVMAAPTQIGEVAERTVAMSCDDPAVIGPRFGQRWTTVSLEITESSRYHIVAAPREATALEWIQVRRCDLSCFEYPDDVLSLTTGSQFGGGFCLSPGRYLFRFAVDSETDGDYQLRVTKTDGTCG